MKVTDIIGPAEEDMLPAAQPKLTDEVPRFFLGSSSIADDYLKAQDGERRRLGRELHDSTGQLLVALSLSVAHLRHSHDPGQTDEILGEIDDAVRQIDQEIRTLSFVYYPAELGKNDLVVALEAFAKNFGKRTGLKVRFQSCCQHAEARPDVAAALLRIAQEALTNVHRHAHAGSVQVCLAEQREVVELSIRDDGRGLPPPAHLPVDEGVGLRGMRHRIEQLGGSFKVQRLRQGTKVIARLPVAQFYARKLG